MNAALVIQNPIVSGVTVFAALILAFTIFRSWLRGRWERAENPIYRIEPDIDRHPVPSSSYADGAGPRLVPVRHGGIRKGVLAFLVGVLCGVFVVPMAFRDGTIPAMSAISAVQEKVAELIGEIDPTLVGAIGGADDAPEAFVLAMRKELPKRIDDRTTLVSVEGDERVVTLAHRVSGSIADAETASFAEAAKDRIVTGTCKDTAGAGIRALNDDGVEFRFVYADTVGRTIAAITLEPDFCERSR